MTSRSASCANRNGSVVYWPNLGYGRFGRQIGMRGAPVFDRPDRRPARRHSRQGTAALVWSTDLPHRQGTHIAFVDLMSAGKPYLILSSKNNMGAETRVEYAPSTRFYLEDRAAGKPWKTRLPFPTHVIERVEVRDHVTGHTFVQKGGMLQSVAVNVRGAVTATDIVTNIDYNARGQRTVIAYGNGSTTDYEYDARTFRVTRIRTIRPNPDPHTVQDLHYHYDPVGNIARIRDQAQQGVFFDNDYADPTQSFVYDAIYRLTSATGREHATLTMPTAEGFAPIAHPQDSQLQRNYTQRYTYDPVGNILRMKHESGMTVVWQRGYDYHPGGNQLRATSAGLDNINDPPNYSVPYSHDAHGNMNAMPNIPGGLTWDDDDRLQSSDSIGGGKTYYVYDGAGQRVRKVHVNQSGTTSRQRLYFGSWETYREHKNINTTNDLDLERETLHVHDDHGCVCLIETKTVDAGAPVVTPANIARYQYSNHLGTANLELDDDAEVISYEEFHPYGTSSYRAANNAIEVSAKRYRYTGQERDEETGLAYHGARYYAPWLGRWTAADPLGLADGTNRYLYTRSNPVILVDWGGTRAEQPDSAEDNYGVQFATPIVGATDKSQKTAFEFIDAAAQWRFRDAAGLFVKQWLWAGAGMAEDTVVEITNLPAHVELAGKASVDAARNYQDSQKFRKAAGIAVAAAVGATFALLDVLYLRRGRSSHASSNPLGASSNGPRGKSPNGGNGTPPNPGVAGSPTSNNPGAASKPPSPSPASDNRSAQHQNPGDTKNPAKAKTNSTSEGTPGTEASITVRPPARPVPVPVRVRGFPDATLREGSTIRVGETMAQGDKIDDLARLVKEHGGTPEKWRKIKGTGMVDYGERSISRTEELHWYENSEIGRVEIKVKTRPGWRPPPTTY
ncbi:RHS repeat-associated core domain-containing protein [Nannocystis punicea]|uniref:Insecticide toxin TcdB middle/N-terminal domain-containing protein n=1 Tax=Nannocystis punicea TaxID=2995304 RepID=A0ABY7H1N4_9BACT|nr:RHS repeat-associated core domain-containing protein [Nannocystis poenicansa]WAS93150.1 hypothetical protein O0S08_43865 [Nannocystis poenicansa]